MSGRLLRFEGGILGRSQHRVSDQLELLEAALFSSLNPGLRQNDKKKWVSCDFWSATRNPSARLLWFLSRSPSRTKGVLSQNLNANILMMQPAEDWDRCDAAELVPPPELWNVLLQ
jgi:hypothetical protein